MINDIITEFQKTRDMSVYMATLELESYLANRDNRTMSEYMGYVNLYMEQIKYLRR